MMHWLRRPYPFIESSTVKLWLSLGIGLLCFLFLGIFKPFGLHEVSDMGFIALFGLNATFSLFGHFFLLPAVVPSWFDSRRWTISHQLVFVASILLLISVFNYLLNSTVGRDISPQYGFLYFIFMTTAVGVLPILLMTYVTESVARTRNETSAVAMTQSLPALHMLESSSLNVQPQITIHGDNAGDTPLVLFPDDLIYASSANNYVEIRHLKEAATSRTLLRLSLKGLQEQLAGYPQFLRCHKSFLINKKHVKSAEGNARSLLLTLAYTDERIPVSRSFDQALLA